MDPRVFHQWPNQIRVAGGRAIPGLIVKAGPRGQTTPSGAAVATPQQATSLAPVSSTAAAPPKPATQLPTHEGPSSFKMPSVATPEGLKLSPETKEVHRLQGQFEQQFPELNKERQQRRSGGGNGAGPPKPPKPTAGPKGDGGAGKKEARLKGEMGKIKQSRERAATPGGPNVLGNFGFGYQIGLTAGSPEGPAAASGMAAHKVMGGVHGMMQTQDSDRDRMHREAYSQRAEQLRIMRQGSQSSLNRSIPLVVTGIRRIG